MAIGDKAVSVGSKGDGYPCPKDGTTLQLIEPNRGAWCPECNTVWTELDEVSLADLDAIATPDE